MLGFQHWYVYPAEGSRFQVTFEQFADSISNWPGMYFEMDGSFVWSIPLEALGERAQIDGMVYDRDDRIEYLDLKGNARPQDWLTLFASLARIPGEDVSEQIRIFDNSKQAWLTLSDALPPHYR